MNAASVCFILAAGLALLAQTVVSVPLTQGADGFVDDRPDLVLPYGPHHPDIRERREAMEGVVTVDKESSPLLSRLRRQVAVMASGGRRYSNSSRRKSRGRLTGRIRYHQRRAHRGRVQNW